MNPVCCPPMTGSVTWTAGDDDIYDGNLILSGGITMSRKVITTNDGGPRMMEVAPRPRVPGPTTNGSAVQTPKEFVQRNAVDSEWESFRAIVARRIDREPREIWQICENCHDVSTRGFRSPAGRPCFKCNFAGREDGGKYRDLLPGEVAAYKRQKAAADAAWNEQMKTAAYNENVANRRKTGLEPLTREAWDEKRKQEFETRKARDKEMLDLARKLAAGLPR